MKEADSQFANSDYEVLEVQVKTLTKDGDMNLDLRIFENLKEASGSSNQNTADHKTFFFPFSCHSAIEQKPLFHIFFSLKSNISSNSMLEKQK